VSETLDAGALLRAVLRVLKTEQRYEDYLAACVKLAREHPFDVDVRMEAAFACDAYGEEHDAHAHYKAGWELGVPAERKREFVLGYGSTLRNTGLVAESVRVLQSACDEFSDDRALRVFLALALHSAGRNGEAMAMMLDLVLSLSDTASDLEPYERAMAFYRDELRALAGAR